MLVVVTVTVGILRTVCKSLEKCNGTNKGCDNSGALSENNTAWNGSNTPDEVRKLCASVFLFILENDLGCLRRQSFLLSTISQAYTIIYILSSTSNL